MVQVDAWLVLALVVLVAFGVGVSVWLIRDRTRIPARVKIDRLLPEEVDPDLLPVLAQYDSELAALGFERAGEFRVAGLETETPHRVYINQKERSLAMVSVLSVGLNKKGHLEFFTKFQDNNSLSTDMALVPNFLSVPETLKLHRLSPALSPERLWVFHKQKLEESRAGGRTPAAIDKGAIYKNIQQDQQELIDYQIKSGLFSVDSDQEFLIPSWKYALFFLFKIIDPIPFGLSTTRLIFGIGSCAAILFGSFLLARWDGLPKTLESLPATEHQVRYIVAGLGALIAGVSGGYLLKTRGVLWGGAISLAGLFLIQDAFPNNFIVILICAYAGLVGNRIEEYRQSKMITRFTGPLIILLGMVIIGWFMLEKSVMP